MNEHDPRPVSVCLAGFAAGKGSGISRYAATLARALDEVSPDFPSLTMSLMTTAAGASAVGARHLRVREFGRVTPGIDRGPLRVPLEQVALAGQRSDLIHFFDLTGPLLVPRRTFVTTMHDAGVVYGFRRFRHAYKRRLHPWALRHAAAVVAVSGFAKEEALRHFSVPAAKITVIHSGPGLTPQSVSPEGAAASGGRFPYLLYVGDLSIKKNVRFLVRAFGRADVPDHLVLAGRPGDGFGRLEEEIRASPKRERIDVLHGPTDGELDGLYRSATALLLPSRYEGFGFTPLEAMSRGCPVLASDVPAVREISGSGAELLPVDDEAAWADAIARIVHDGLFREQLEARGAKTAARYSWHDTARTLCALFEHVAAKERGL
jgi:glycosyltransferase involved in cell wall biosynthesis